MSEDMKELEQKISEAEKTMLQAKEVYEATIEKLAVLLEQRDRIRRGLDGGRVTLDQWSYNWNGNAIWDYGTVTMDCHYQAKMTFSKGDSVVRGPEVQKLEQKTGVINVYVNAQAIQVNGHVTDLAHLAEYIKAERSSMSAENAERLTVSLKADKHTPMGVIADVKETLQQSFALRINYSGTETRAE